jgi:hypothetical protein
MAGHTYGTVPTQQPDVFRETLCTTFYLSRIAENLPDELRNFDYSFQVIPQNFDVQIINTKAYDQTQLRRQKIEGILQTADYAETKKVGKYHSGASILKTSRGAFCLVSPEFQS